MMGVLACQPGSKEIGATVTSTASTTDAETSSSTETSTTAQSTETSASSEGSSVGDASGSTSADSTGPDPDYVRDCQPDDFVCDDFGCDESEAVELGECYKPCTPSAIGELDDECDEPERPFCSQVGRALGGDFDCNACVHVCVSASFNQCQQSIDACS